MLLDNKYKKWYFSIIEKATNRVVSKEYYEKHHIIPKSLGGDDSNTNIVKLTAREHFICHLLLTKIVDGDNKYKMIKAAKMMAVRHGPGQDRYVVTSRTYSLIKENIEVPLNVRLKMSNSQKNRFKDSVGTFLGKNHSNETRTKMSIAASKSKSELWKESASKNRKGKVPPNKGKTYEELYGIERAQQLKEKVKKVGKENGFYGKHHSPEQREKKRQEKLATPKKICYHCGKEVDSMNYARWHGDRCKSKK